MSQWPLLWRYNKCHSLAQSVSELEHNRMDSPSTVDRRVRRTQRLLSDALLALIVEKGIDAITIKDITDRADVAYVTFFRHYKDKEALLLQRLDEELATLRTGAEAAAQAVEAGGAERAKGQLIFQYARENEALYRALFGSQGAWRVRAAAQRAIAEVFLETCSPLHGSRVIPPSLAANHMAASLLAMIDWWLDQERPASAEQIAGLYDQLIVTATLQAVGPETQPEKHGR
jgi:AcrR family transcriptional regulator